MSDKLDKKTALMFADSNRPVYLVEKEFVDTGGLTVEPGTLYQPYKDYTDHKFIEKLLEDRTLTIYREVKR